MSASKCILLAGNSVTEMCVYMTLYFRKYSRLVGFGMIPVTINKLKTVYIYIYIYIWKVAGSIPASVIGIFH